jgi:N-acyl-D-amino-acid deacylase
MRAGLLVSDFVATDWRCVLSSATEMTKRIRSIIGYTLAALLLCTHAARLPAMPPARQTTAQGAQVDLLLRRGKVIDGSGAAPRVLDVGIRGERIVFIGDAVRAGVTAARTIDARGLVVAPGFIDPHTHTMEDLSDAARKSNENYLMQGVTTVVTGNDGSSAVSIAERLDKWTQAGIGTNAALLAGHATIRSQVLGQTDAQPDAAQLAQMKALMAQAMADGAFGMSTGLYYAPGSYAKTEEVIELAQVCAAQGGIYDTHMRDENSYSIGLLGSIRETIRIGREAHIPVHISHIKALGPEVWGQSRAAIRLINQARRAGVDVTANQYPYNASGTGLVAALVPRWAEVGGRAEMLKRFDDPALRPRLVSDMEANLKRRGGAESLLLTTARDPQLVGQTLGTIAKARNESPVEAAIEIIRVSAPSVASFNMSAPDIERFMRQPWVMTGSDGSTGHPRKYGTFPHKLREYVYNKRLITLPFFVRHSSALTAETFRIPERGRLRVGYYADVIAFDEKTVADRATYVQPELLSVGMRYVIVNGQLAVEDGKYTGALAGRALRKNRP